MGIGKVLVLHDKNLGVIPLTFANAMKTCDSVRQYGF